MVVDDCIIEGNDEEMRKKVEDRLQTRFNIKAFESVETFIGIQLEDSLTHVKIHQKKYVDSLLERFNMVKCLPQLL